MKRIFLTLTVTIMAVFGGGCASVLTHSYPGFGSDSPAGVYRGVRADARFALSPARKDPQRWPGVFITAPLALSDMRLSAIVDTCALPGDLK